MKNKLNYQTSEYDCGPTTLINAIRYLFEREEIPPDIIKAITMYTLDAFDNNGECGKSGTSKMAMIFLENWFNQFGKTRNFPLYTEMLIDEKVDVKVNGKIIECLQQGGVVILCVWHCDYRHYILVTDLDLEHNEFGIFDPYDCDVPVNGTTITNVEGYPKKMNRRIKIDIVDQITEDCYSLGAMEGREAMLLFNKNTRKSPEKTIEFFI